MLTVVAPQTGCTDESTTVVIDAPASSADTSGAITPLERGAVRREVLDGAREAVDAWTSGDLDMVAEHFAPGWVDTFAEIWSEHESRGLTIVHQHDVEHLDVVDMNDGGTQALVDYVFIDRTTVVDSDGSVVEPATGRRADTQLTMEPDGSEPDGSGDWRVVRMIVPKEVLR